MDTIVFAILVIAIFEIILWIQKKIYEKTTYYQETQTPYLKTMSDKGATGEYKTYKAIEGLDAEYERFLFNVYIPTGTNKWTEIDIIYINRSGIYVIENKNYSGWIFGSAENRTWTVTYGKNAKRTFYNPILQNKKHIIKVKEVLLKSCINTSTIKSIICFNNEAELKKVPDNSYDIKVINSRNLRRTIMENQQMRLNTSEINKAYAALKIYANASEEIKQQHIRNVKGKYYRRQK